MKKINKYLNLKDSQNSGFVMALTVVILGIILALTAVIVSLGAIQNSNDMFLAENTQQKILCEQLEYDFMNLSENEFKSHLKHLGALSIDNANNFSFKGKFKIRISENYTKLEVFEFEDDKLVFEKHK